MFKTIFCEVPAFNRVDPVNTSAPTATAIAIFANRASGTSLFAITATVKLWVSQDGGLPVRLESNGALQGIATHTVQSIEYDKGITITAPTP